MKTIVIFFVVALSGCASNGVPEEDAKSLLETLEFGDDECGQFQVTGNMQAGTTVIPWVSTDVYVNLDKRKPCADEEVTP